MNADIKKKIEEESNKYSNGMVGSKERLNWADYDFARGMERGISLMQEEVDSAVREWDKLKLRFDVATRESKQQLGFAEEIEKQMQTRIEQDAKTIESQAKEISELKSCLMNGHNYIQNAGGVGGLFLGENVISAFGFPRIDTLLNTQTKNLNQ